MATTQPTARSRRQFSWTKSGARGSEGPLNPAETDLSVTLEGESPRFTSPDLSFAIWNATRDVDGARVSVQGPLARCAGGEVLSCSGKWKEHPQHGWSFVVSAYKSALPQNAEGIQRWLQARVKGIGPTFAKAITDLYGAKSFEVIDADPKVLYSLRSAKGVAFPRSTVDQVIAVWGEVRAMRQIETWLFGAGVTANLADKLYRRYGDDVITVLEEDPYRIVELPGVGFRVADKIALGLDWPKDDPRRVRAGVEFSIEEAEGDGHSYVTLEQLFNKVANELGVGNKQLIANEAAALVKSQQLVVEPDETTQRVYRTKTWRLEVRVARMVRALIEPATSPLLGANPVRPVVPAGMTPEEARAKHIYVPTDLQWDALKMISENRLALLTGGPGVGKSASQDMIISAAKKAGRKVALTAPTGKAARRMTELTGEPATTVHRLLEWSPFEGGFQRDESNPLEVDLVVCDESSMLSLDLADALVRAIGPGTHLLLVGDPDQLPPVGVGKFLSDLIDSEKVPRTHLDQVFRQAAGSMIITNAHRINRGEMPYLRHADAEQAEGRTMDKDAFWISRKTPEETAELVVDFAAERVPKTFGLDPVSDVMVLAPMYKGACGLEVLNERMQTYLNEHGRPIGMRNIRVGDRIAQNRNDYTPGRETSNGQVGIVTTFDPDAAEAHIKLDDDRTIVLPVADMETWSLAWAMSIHKSQGSQWPAVVTAVSSAHYVMLSRALTYTAVTRAQKLVVIVGETKAMNMAVSKVDMKRRNSTLIQRIHDAEISGELF